MSALSLVTDCPEWCESTGKMGDGEQGHDGPAWPKLPSDGGADVLEIFARLWQGRVSVYVSAIGVDLTPEQALEAGRYLIEAGQWAIAHGVTE